jgi:predicted TIM-barrel fold metal-dependent hydrolase
MSTIDFHVHAFPDALAERATARVERAAGIRSALDGTIGAVVSSMEAAGIERSVILSIATSPSQFDPILEWSRTIRSPRIVPFLSVHPADPRAAHKVRLAASMGFKGFKFHPYYQKFSLDEERMFPVYEAMQETGLILVSHTGFDTAHPYTRIADPPRILRVLERFPSLTFVATHLGAWQDWDLVAQLLPKAGLWTDISYSLPFLPAEKARALIAAFPADRLLFGSDSPWADQAESIRQLRGLGLEARLEEAILGGNAEKLLDR